MFICNAQECKSIKIRTVHRLVRFYSRSRKRVFAHFVKEHPREEIQIDRQRFTSYAPQFLFRFSYRQPEGEVE